MFYMEDVSEFTNSPELKMFQNSQIHQNYSDDYFELAIVNQQNSSI